MKAIFVIGIIVSFLIDNPINAQTGFDFFPSQLHFRPIKANYQEASLGFQHYAGTSDYKIDIGNTIDIAEFEYKKTRFSLGAELMGYAFSTSYDQYLFQIDALDGLFSANAVFSFSPNEENKYFLRYRILHNSAHFVDGYFLAKKEAVARNQIGTFNRNFHEFTLSHEINSDVYFRYYASAAFTIHAYTELNDPALHKSKLTNLKNQFYNTGFEFVIKDILGSFIADSKNIFFNYHFNLDGAEEYFGNSNFMAGLKFGSWLERGVGFYASYYTGKDVFNKYFNNKVKRFGIGFFLDF